MDKINSTCLSPDIIWFSLAIRNQPFYEKIDKVLQSYAKILQSEIDQVFEFIRQTDLSSVIFRTPPKFKLFQKKDDKLSELSSKLKNA
jgi:cell shape-determining protein MreC